MSIFNEDKKEDKENKLDSQPNDASVNNQFDDLLNGIKNDSGERKYNTVESALEALKHSQEYIPNLQGDKDKLTQEVESLKSQQTKVDELTAIVEKLTAPKEETVNQPSTSFNEQDVAKMVQAALTQNQAETTKEKNIKSVTDALMDSFGTEAEKTFYGKAEELGMSKEAFNDLAGTSPKAVLAFFGASTQQPSITKGTQGVNHNFQKPTPSGKVERADRSVMAGASTGDLKAEMQRHKEAVYAKYGVQH